MFIINLIFIYHSVVFLMRIFTYLGTGKDYIMVLLLTDDGCIVFAFLVTKLGLVKWDVYTKCTINLFKVQY